MATSLEIFKKISDLSSAPKVLSYGVKIAKIARGLHFAYDTKLVAMATSLEELEKTGPDEENSRKYLPFGEKIVKIGQVDTEIALFIVKKEKKKKLTQAKYITLPASLPSGLKEVWIEKIHANAFHLVKRS